MTLTRFPRWATIACFMAILVNCQNSGFSESSVANTAASNGSAGQTTSQIAGGQVIELDTKSTTSSAIEVPYNSIGDLAMVVVSLGDNGLTQGYQITTDSAAPHSLATNFLTQGNAAEENQESKFEGDVTEEFHAELRGIELDIPVDAETPEVSNVRFATTNSDEKTFQVIQGFSSTGSTVVTGTLVYETENFRAYVDKRDLDDVVVDDIAAILDDFDAVIPAEREMFGEESDINNDGHFDILMTREVNKLGVRYGGLITGYFFASDLFSKSQFPISNEREVLFTMVPDSDGTHGVTVPYELTIKNILPGVLPHEFQHMISFNRHYFESNSSPEVGWLNEGLSHLAEDIYSQNSQGYMTTTGIENPSRVARYLNNVSLVCFTCGSSLEQRGGSYLFLRYAYEQAERGLLNGLVNGADLIDALMSGKERDLANVYEALSGETHNPQGFEDLLGKFALAIYLSGTDVTTDDSQEIFGLNLRLAQEDTRGTILNGPAIKTVANFPYVGTTTGYSLTFIHIPEAEVKANKGRFFFNSANNSRFKAFFIRD